MAATAVAAAAGAITLPVQGAAAAETGAPQDCAIETLPIPDGLLFTFTTGMSDDGSVVAYRAYPTAYDDYERYPLLYSEGKVTEVPIPGEDQQIADVNSSGDGAGFTYLGGPVPYALRDGVVAELPNDDGGTANGINEQGDIVGARGQFAHQMPVMWPADRVKPVDLPLPQGVTWGTAVEIGDDGTIVGYHEDAEGDFVPYMWDEDGEGAPLPMPEGVDPTTAHSYVSDLNGDWASGYLSTPELDGVGVVWNLEEGTATVTDLSGPVAVSAEGTTAGQSFPHAAYQAEGGKVVELPGVTDPADNTFGDRAAQISEDGSVLAGSVFAGRDPGGRHILNAVVWTCE